MKPLLIAGFALLLAGCASLSDDARFSEVEQAVKERTGAETKWCASDDEANTVRGAGEGAARRSRSARRRPCRSRSSTIPGLQASYAEVGIAEADLVQASRWRGPTFSFAPPAPRRRESRSSAACSSTCWACSRSRSRRRRARSDCEGAQNRAAAEALRVALDTRKAWFQAVAAQETAKYMGQVKEAAEASAELARRMAAVGQLSEARPTRASRRSTQRRPRSSRARGTTPAAARERLCAAHGPVGRGPRLPAARPAARPAEGAARRRATWKRRRSRSASTCRARAAKPRRSRSRWA